MYFTDTERGCFAKDPAVVHFGGKYYLYYTFKYTEPCADGRSKIGVGIATSTDLETFTKVGEVPLTQPCEQNGIGAPAAIVLRGKVHLFYQTYGNGKSDALCHAVSTDGTHFEKHPENPIYHPPATWCCGRAIDADVCLYRGKLYLYFATRDHAMAVQKIGGAVADPDSDFSRGAWRALAEHTLLAPELVWEGACIEAPATITNDGQMFLFYGGSYNCEPQQIGCAVSNDGIFFERISTEPFLPCGLPGTWNSSESGHPYAFRDDDGRAYLFYQGSADMGKTWYLSKTEIFFDENNLPHRK